MKIIQSDELSSQWYTVIKMIDLDHDDDFDQAIVKILLT